MAEPLASLLTDGSENSDSGEIRLAVAEIIGATASQQPSRELSDKKRERLIESLTRMIASPDPIVADLATESLARFGPSAESALPVLNARLAAAGGLAEAALPAAAILQIDPANSRAAETLGRALTSRSPTIRMLSAEALPPQDAFGMFRNPDDVPPGAALVPTVRRALIAETAEVRVDLLANLAEGHFPGEALGREVRAQFNHPDPAVRRQAARAVGVRSDLVADPEAAVRSLLNDPDASVRAEALRQWVRLPGLPTDLLFERLNDADATTTGVLAQRIPSDVEPRRLPELRAAFDRENLDGATRRALATAILLLDPMDGRVATSVLSAPDAAEIVVAYAYSNSERDLPPQLKGTLLQLLRVDEPSEDRARAVKTLKAFADASRSLTAARFAAEAASAPDAGVRASALEAISFALTPWPTTNHAGYAHGSGELAWPPPAWSLLKTLTGTGLGAPTATMQEFANRIGLLLDGRGYEQRAVIGIPDGFLIVTQIERFDPETGRPSPPPDRWNTEWLPLSRLRVRDWFARILHGPTGHFRVFLIAVTPDRRPDPGVATPTFDLTSGWAQLGGSRLPPGLADERHGDRSVHVLIYQFEKTEGGVEFKHRPPPTLGVLQHLRAAGLWDGLQDRPAP
ncbi:hypothetical protein CA12_28660 [Alienimonas californiensis]|uniref:HEAT repeat protein n=1 Tax=Alienimonas californiensis TaxID=2527989 RepID=A0A517PBL4_9PLAN|nr:hypothetical protein CA12_28660 [Alienimonas californiensis]